MAKEKLSFKNGSRLCFQVKEIDLKSFYDKIVEVATTYSNDSEFIIELRIDYLINKKVDVKDIIDCISRVKKYLAEKFEIERQMIVTLRNFSNGGNCLLNKKDYASIVETIYEKAKVDAIDIDYDFYEENASFVKKLFTGKKTLIITYNCQDRVLSKEEYNELFKTLLKTPAYVVKVMTKAFSTDDTENLMNTAKEFEPQFEKHDKVNVVISTGKLGIASRIMYEYTDTKIIYLDTYELDMVPAGEINKKIFDKYRKLIANAK
jgi:3-dehydroquinate dehydratase type I